MSEKLSAEKKRRIVSNFEQAQQNLVLQSADYPLSVFAQMVDQGSLDLAPDFQRRRRWVDSTRSQLIESFMLNVPVPPVYFSEDHVGKYSVIDGQQRLSAGVDFVNDGFKLSGLEKIPELNGLKFSELPEELRSAVSARPYMRVIILLRQSDPNLKFEVFERLNRGGVRLNDQEVRNAVYRGPMNDLIYRLSEEPFLRKQLKIQGPKDDPYLAMKDAEFVTRFLAFKDGWRNYTGNLSQFLDRYMQEYQFADNLVISKASEDFKRALDACERIFGDQAFKRPQETGYRDQAMATMYDAEMIALYNATDQQIEKLASRSNSVCLALSKGFNEGIEGDVNFTGFEDAVRTNTNTSTKVRRRISVMHNFLQAQAE